MITVTGEVARRLLQELNDPTEEQLEKRRERAEKCRRLAQSITVKPKEPMNYKESLLKLMEVVESLGFIPCNSKWAEQTMEAM